MKYFFFLCELCTDKFLQIQDLPGSSGIMQVSINQWVWMNQTYTHQFLDCYFFPSLKDNGSWQEIGVCCIIRKLLFLSTSLFCWNPISNHGCSQVSFWQLISVPICVCQTSDDIAHSISSLEVLRGKRRECCIQWNLYAVVKLASPVLCEYDISPAWCNWLRNYYGSHLQLSLTGNLVFQDVLPISSWIVQAGRWTIWEGKVCYLGNISWEAQYWWS